MEVCAPVGMEHARCGGKLLEPPSGFLAARAIARAGQNRPTDCHQFHLAAPASRGEVVALSLFHCDHPFVGPIYEIILASVRNVRNGSTSEVRRCNREVRFARVSRHRQSSPSGPVSEESTLKPARSRKSLALRCIRSTLVICNREREAAMSPPSPHTLMLPHPPPTPATPTPPT